MKLMYKYHHKLLPASFHDYFQPILHNINTRHSVSNFLSYPFNNKYGKYSPSNMCIKLWSSIPDCLKNENFAQFRFYIINRLRDNYVT